MNSADSVHDRSEQRPDRPVRVNTMPRPKGRENLPISGSIGRILRSRILYKARLTEPRGTGSEASLPCSQYKLD